MPEDKWIAWTLIALLVVQLCFLGALFYRLGAVQRNLIYLNQAVALAGSGEGGGVVDALVDGVEPGDGPAMGAADAAVTVVEFSDFECGVCRRSQATLEELVAGTSEVRRVYRHFPLGPPGSDSFRAALAAECAHRQGKFWGMHERLFAASGELARERILAAAAELGLEREPFLACLEAEETTAAVLEDREAGRRWGVSGTPTFFVNGRRVAGMPGLPALEAVVEQARGDA